MLKSRSLCLRFSLVLLCAVVLIRPHLIWHLEFLQDYLLVPLFVLTAVFFWSLFAEERKVFLLVAPLVGTVIIIKRIPPYELRRQILEPPLTEVHFPTLSLKTVEGDKEPPLPFTWSHAPSGVTIGSPINAVSIRTSLGDDLPPVVQLRFEPSSRETYHLSLLALDPFSSSYGRQQERLLIRRFCSYVRHRKEEVKVLVKSSHSAFAPALAMLKHRCDVRNERGTSLAHLVPGKHYYLFSRKAN